MRENRDVAAEYWERLSGWLNAWLSADPLERGRLRADLAREAPHLLAEADALSNSSVALGAFLETPAIVLAARELTQEDAPIRPGSMAGPYRVVSLLARGGMGDVYRATDVRLHRDVALKVLARTRTDDPQRLERFIHEARLTASLNHPNLVRLYDVGHSDGRAYLVAELLEGETLRARIARGRIPIAEVLPIALQIVRGLAAAHDAGLVHRDLKPENIFLTRSGSIKILDFGIAKLSQDETVRDGLSTLTGVVLGTAGYLAPEQVRGERVGTAADLFGVGAVLFEMLTGSRAFAREHVVETLYAILHEQPAHRLADDEDVPPALAAIVMRLLEKSPDARFASCAELLTALEALSTGGLASAPETPRTLPAPSTDAAVTRDADRASSPRRLRQWAAVASIVVAAGVAVTWYARRPAALPDAGPVAAVSVPEGQRDAGSTATQNSEAFEAYLRGRAYVMKATRAELALAADHFTEAVRLDPRFADAWAGLAQAYRRMPIGGDVRPEEAFEPAREAARNALRLDPDNAEAHSALAAVAFWYDWDYAEAERLLRLALQADPNSADARIFLAHLFSNLGRHDEAVVEIRKARALDPAWPVARSLEGQFLYMARRYDEALERLDHWCGSSRSSRPAVSCVSTRCSRWPGTTKRSRSAAASGNSATPSIPRKSCIRGVRG